MDFAKNNPEVLAILQEHTSPKLERQESISQRDPAEVRQDLIEAIDNDDFSKFYNTLFSLPSEYGVRFQEINLKQIDPKGDIFLKAIMMGNPHIIKEFLNDEADPNLKNKNGLTALHYAALNGNEEVVRTLLESGADINAQDSKGQTPMDFAKNNPEVLGILQEHASPKLEIQASIPQRDPEAVRESLINAINQMDLQAFRNAAEGADFKSIRNPGVLLVQAAKYGDNDIVNELLKSGIDPNVIEQGRSALHIAASRGDQEMVALLLKHDADINAKDHAGKTPMDLAKNNPEVLATLQKYASDRVQNVFEQGRRIVTAANVVKSDLNDPKKAPYSTPRLLRKSSSDRSI